MPAQNDFERAIERATGMSIDHIRDTPLCQLRKEAEVKSGKPITTSPASPFIMTHEEVERQLDIALK